MNSTNFIQTGGWPLNSERLQELQTSFSIFNAFGSLAGNFTIVEGCETEGSTVKNGKIYINNELLDFRESLVDANSKVIIVEESVNRPFENGSIKAVHTIRYATFGTSEVSWPWSDFVRPLETKLIKGFLDKILTRLSAAETKLEKIEDGAQKNVQSDFDVTDSKSSAFIKNKPAYLKVLTKGSKNIGNVTTNSYSIVIAIEDVGTANYQVLGSIRSNSTNFHLDNNVFHNTREHTAKSFMLCLREMSNDDQNISFDYTIIQK